MTDDNLIKSKWFRQVNIEDYWNILKREERKYGRTIICEDIG